MSRALVLSISLAALGLALSLGALAWTAGGESPPSDRQVLLAPRARTSVEAHAPTRSPVPTASPRPTQATPSLAASPAAAATPAPIPAPTPQPTPPPTPVPTPLVLTKEVFLAGRLLIPSIGVAAPFEEKGVDANLVMQDPSGRTAVAWYNFKSLPNGGGNVFLAGHLELGGVPAVFWDLQNVVIGDDVIIQAGGAEFRYSIVSEEYMTKADSLHSVIDPVPGEVVTMMTCAGEWVPAMGDYSHRWIVRAVRVY